MNDPLTKAELIEVMDTYIKPFYDILGGALAFLVIAAAVYLVIIPLIPRRI